ncbi:MAG: class I SAM-dependent methyltransferase [Sphingobacteriaceae bacterium]|nr:MAG: class I SAM-dependent methyltransferase [Sphingobacteriaceae bacterium]
MPNNYDAVARFYDGLAKLVFGKALIKAQRFLVENISAEKNILIVGGGTGWILEEFAAYTSDLQIVYVEISAEMLRLARQKDCGKNAVIFVHSAIEDYQPDQSFDVIFTAFLFDNFVENRIKSVFNQLHQSLKPGGKWLLSDFRVEKNLAGLWQNMILQTMYWFFGWLCKVEAKKLVAMEKYFQAENYQLLKEKIFYSGFISSKVYQSNFKNSR